MGTRWELNTWSKNQFEFVFDIIVPLDYCISNVTWREVIIFICMHCFSHMVQQHSYFCLGGFHLPEYVGIVKIPLHPCHEVDCY